MTKPFLTLLGTSFRGWIGAKGVWMLAFAAVLPMLLTGAWAGTHQADIVQLAPTWVPAQPLDGQPVTFFANISNGPLSVGAFNATLAVGTLQGNNFFPFANTTIRVHGMGPGAKKELTLQWTAQSNANLYVFAQADTGNEINEVDKTNNLRVVPLRVNYSLANATNAPTAPTNLTGNPAGPKVDLQVSVSGGGQWPITDGTHTWTATITNRGNVTARNATVTLRIGPVFGNQMTSPLNATTQNFTLAAGAQKVVSLQYAPAAGSYWADAFVNTTGSHDTNVSALHAAVPFAVQPTEPPQVLPPTSSLPQKADIKSFYLDVLGLLQLRILVPFIALFYAGGVLTDEKEKGSLPYVLTRPVERWLIPIVKFIAGFAVAAIAIILGIVGTYLILFQATPQGKDIGFLTTPLIASLLALLAYGGFFTALGVVFDRPYLIGLAYVIGWEAIVSNFVPWVSDHLSINHLVDTALAGWALDQGIQWLPAGVPTGTGATTPQTVAAAVTAVEYLVIAAFVFLAFSAFWMKRREFDL
ncbi:MAG: ABC transporter permease subunit [Thermoplasmatota archaeon]